MVRLGIPEVKMFAHFLEKGCTEWFSTECEDTFGKIEKLKYISVLTASERPGNPFINCRLFFPFDSFDSLSREKMSLILSSLHL